MRYFRICGEDRDHLAVQEGDLAYDLTTANESIGSFRDLAAAASITGDPIDAVTDRLLDRAPTVGRAALEDARRPLDPDEVWAAGVTYEISEQAREAESGMPEMYLNVYEGDRPEIFFKATAERTVGPGAAIGVREDSEWDVPEPELAMVLYRGEVVGFTIGNDVSSRSIEGENALYLPQAKVYDRCCAVGPAVVSAATVDDPHDLEMSMTITRDDETLYDESTSTGEMVRTCEELASYYTCHNAVPELAVLLTGTSLVPSEEFTLREGDLVAIDIDGIGRLKNPVVTV
ncbi:fumarylacetoacetate hydrolase family protein [Halococcus salifodinae]|uniref:Fumarylacetoacetate (FAA) hydrolase n=1 Tax=Halococcus salifodinae DSM 8989 TaxID=1227456 RepID=M0MS23_9EURY|nr:fumarylacetoacetate hydrolase family protein [Halococcus salifodinae]EMA48168.1 fumarylacetoacetate (FAA) hydrolase [Halococcus salifodinae DSM 8989]